MSNRNNLPNKNIDGDKLKGLLRTYCQDNKTTILKMNCELGYSRNYLNQACNQNTISQMAVFYLEAKGIKPEEYVVNKPKVVVEKNVEKKSVVEEKKEKTIADLTPEEFKILLREAMFEAFKNAWDTV